MNGSWGIDWKEIYTLGSPLAEIVLRGTLVYLALFFMLRFGGKRTAGAIGITDLLVVVVIADAVQNAMASEHKTVLDGLMLAATILFWDYVLDWLGYRSPRLQRLLRPAPVPLVRDGQMLRRNLRQELVTVDELLSLLREQGVEDVASVKAAYIEGDGHISVIQRDSQESRHPAPERPTT